MVSAKCLIVALFVSAVLLLSEMPNTSAAPMHLGGHHGGSAVGSILAAGLVLALLQQQG